MWKGEQIHSLQLRLQSIEDLAITDISILSPNLKG